MEKEKKREGKSILKLLIVGFAVLFLINMCEAATCTNTCTVGGASNSCNGNTLTECSDHPPPDGCVGLGTINCPYGCAGGFCKSCTPNCVGKYYLQSDGCGGVCTGCTPNCAGKQCGDNGCGGTCGTCTGGKTCNSAGLCICTITCTNGQKKCSGNTLQTCINSCWVNTPCSYGCNPSTLKCKECSVAQNCANKPLNKYCGVYKNKNGIWSDIYDCNSYGECYIIGAKNFYACPDSTPICASGGSGATCIQCLNAVDCANKLAQPYCSGNSVVTPSTMKCSGYTATCIPDKQTTQPCTGATPFCDIINGVAKCVGCRSNYISDCPGGDACNIASCNPATGKCIQTPKTCNSAGLDGCCPTGCSSNPADGIYFGYDPDCNKCLTKICDNGIYCDGAETCNHATGVCQAGTPPDCNPSISDNCCPSGCSPNHFLGTEDIDCKCSSGSQCSNEDYCDGPETCNINTKKCQAGTPPNCNDEKYCTIDDCDSLLGCSNNPEPMEGEICDIKISSSASSSSIISVLMTPVNAVLEFFGVKTTAATAAPALEKGTCEGGTCGCPHKTCYSKSVQNGKCAYTPISKYLTDKGYCDNNNPKPNQPMMCDGNGNCVDNNDECKGVKDGSKYCGSKMKVGNTDIYHKVCKGEICTECPTLPTSVEGACLSCAMDSQDKKLYWYPKNIGQSCIDSSGLKGVCNNIGLCIALICANFKGLDPQGSCGSSSSGLSCCFSGKEFCCNKGPPGSEVCCRTGFETCEQQGYGVGSYCSPYKCPDGREPCGPTGSIWNCCRKPGETKCLTGGGGLFVPPMGYCGDDKCYNGEVSCGNFKEGVFCCAPGFCDKANTNYPTCRKHLCDPKEEFNCTGTDLSSGKTFTICCEKGIEMCGDYPRGAPRCIAYKSPQRKTSQQSGTSIFIVRSLNYYTLNGIAYVITPHVTFNYNAMLTMYNYDENQFETYKYENESNVFDVCNSSLLDSVSKNIGVNGGIINYGNEINLNIPALALNNSISFTIAKYNLSNCYEPGSESINPFFFGCFNDSDCAPNSDCKTSSCNSTTGSCDETNKPDGTACALTSEVTSLSPFLSFLKLFGVTLTGQGQSVCNNGGCVSNADKKLIAFYSFEGNANDASGNGNNGVVNGATLTTGKLGQAYSFDGISSNINVGNLASLNFGRNSFSLGAWFKTSSSGHQRIISKGHSGWTNGYVMLLYQGKVFTGVGAGGVQASSTYALTNRTFNDNNWHYVTAVFDFNNNVQKIYVDGVAQDLQKWTGTCGSVSGTMANIGSCNSLSASTSENLEIGSDSGPAAGFFNGLIDEVKIWNYALSDGVIITEYQRGNNVEKKLVAYYPFEENAILADSYNDFSFSQGNKNWYYYRSAPGSNSYTQLSVNDGIWWKVGLPQESYEYLGINNYQQHPGGASYGDAVRAWKSTFTGQISISDVISDGNNACGNGISYQIYKNSQQLFSQSYNNGFNSTNINLVSNVNIGDMIYFRVNNKAGDNGCDSTNERILISKPVADASGNNNNGINNGATFVSGKIGQAYSFNGFNSYIEIPNSASLQDITEGSYTWSAWYYPNSLPSNIATHNVHSIICKQGFHTSLFYENNTSLGLFTWDTTKKIPSTASTSGNGMNNIPNKWYHVAGVVDSTKKSVSIYVNGVFLNSITYFSLLDYGVNPIRIGICNNPGQNYDWPANGIIDEVKIWNYALNSSEISQEYGRGSS